MQWSWEGEGKGEGKWKRGVHNIPHPLRFVCDGLAWDGDGAGAVGREFEAFGWA